MKKPIILFLLMFLSFVFVIAGISPVSTFALSPKSNNEILDEKPKLTAKSALLIEYNTGKVLFDKDSEERLPIASMTKLASLALVFDTISKGLVKESDIVVVSENAASVGGSSAFLDAGSRYKLTDLIKTVVVASANDSTVALAEHIAGSEDVFVSRMNKFADSLGLKNTNFENCTGLPEKNHFSTAKDMAEIYKTVCNNEIYKKYSKIWIDDFIHPSGRKTGLVNTNRLVKTYDGIEGGKTGYTDSAKFCLTASAKRGTLRLIGVIIGANDSKTRFAEMSKLFNFGFSNFTNKLLVNSEVPVTVVPVKKSKTSVEVFAERDSNIFMEKTDERTFSTDFKIYDNIKAPLKAGDKVGKIFVFDQNNMVVDEIDLIVSKDIDSQKFADHLKNLVEAW